MLLEETFPEAVQLSGRTAKCTKCSKSFDMSIIKFHNEDCLGDEYDSDEFTENWDAPSQVVPQAVPQAVLQVFSANSVASSSSSYGTGRFADSVKWRSENYATGFSSNSVTSRSTDCATSNPASRATDSSANYFTRSSRSCATGSSGSCASS